MSPGHDCAPTPANAGATSSQQNLNRSNGNRYGCPAGCGDQGHEAACGVEQPFEVVDRAPCIGRSHTLGVAELRHYGERYGVCPCLVPTSRQRPS